MIPPGRSSSPARIRPRACRGDCRWRIPGSRAAGDLTYPVYLLHAGIGYALLEHWATDATKWWFYVLMLLGLIAAAYTLHAVVEVRCRPWSRRLFEAMVGRPVNALSAVLLRWDERLGGLETNAGRS